MYIPNSYAETDLPTLHAFIEAHPLATVVTHAADGLIASHLPLVLDRSAGPLGTLIGHLARANPHARALAHDASETLVIFTGPQAYVTPEWYPVKKETGRVVPTWNYIAVHVGTTPRLRDDARFLREHLESLTTTHEATRERPWRVDDAPADFIDQQMKAIVAVEFPIDRIEGKWKMSQNRSEADINGVVEGLNASQSPEDRTVASIVDARRPKR
jgi:transcriptional regulator